MSTTKYLTIAQFEVESTLSRPTIYRLIAAGVLPARKVGRRTLILESELERLGQPITADRPGAA